MSANIRDNKWFGLALAKATDRRRRSRAARELADRNEMMAWSSSASIWAGAESIWTEIETVNRARLCGPVAWAR